MRIQERSTIGHFHVLEKQVEGEQPAMLGTPFQENTMVLKHPPAQ